MSAINEPVVSLLAVLDAYACTPPTPGDEGVTDALSRTGASLMKRLEAMWSADRGGMLDEIEIWASFDCQTCSELFALGLETLEKLRFDERTRITSKDLRGTLGDIEREMAGEE